MKILTALNFGKIYEFKVQVTQILCILVRYIISDLYICFTIEKMNIVKYCELSCVFVRHPRENCTQSEKLSVNSICLKKTPLSQFAPTRSRFLVRG